MDFAFVFFEISLKLDPLDSLVSKIGYRIIYLSYGIFIVDVRSRLGFGWSDTILA